MTKHVCDNCGWKGTSPDEIDDIEQRVDAGSEVPSGQCPKCGALCYLWRNDLKKVGLKARTRIVTDAISLLGMYDGLVASILDGNKKPEKEFLRALVKMNKKNTRNLKKLVP